MRISAPILIDSGYRRGTDIVKALALGANAVLLGRATLYGLAAAGEAGVDHVLRLLKDEVDRTFAQIGCPSIGQLSPDYVTADGSMPATAPRDLHERQTGVISSSSDDRDLHHHGATRHRGISPRSTALPAVNHKEVDAHEHS